MSSDGTDISDVESLVSAMRDLILSKLLPS